jgi:hypothetical protein
VKNVDTVGKVKNVDTLHAAVHTVGENNVLSEECAFRQIAFEHRRGLNNDPKSAVEAWLFPLLQQPRGSREHGVATLSRSISRL